MITPSTRFKNISGIVAICLASALATGQALAKDKDGDDNGRGNSKHGQKQADKAKRQDIKQGAYFNDQHRGEVRQSYSQYYSQAKKCPPGLAKKNNGCMPPGQARKWSVGQPVPSTVTIYAVPQPILIKLPPVPIGYRYGRVGADIVLMPQGGRVVVDIILDVFL